MKKIEAGLIIDRVVKEAYTFDNGRGPTGCLFIEYNMDELNLYVNE
jgi:hypothetical protein